MMKLILCAVLLFATVLDPAECRRRSQGYEDEGDLGGPPGGGHGCALMDKLPGLIKSLGSSDQGGLLGMLGGLGQKLGLMPGGGGGGGGRGAGGQNPLSGIIQKIGSALGSGGFLKGLGQGGLGEMLSGRNQGSGSKGRCGGRGKKFGSFGQGRESGRNSYGSEEFERPSRHGSQYGGRQGGHFGHQREADGGEDY